MAKNHDVKVRFNEQEYKKVQRKATELGMSLSGFIRTIALIAHLNPADAR